MWVLASLGTLIFKYVDGLSSSSKLYIYFSVLSFLFRVCVCIFQHKFELATLYKNTFPWFETSKPSAANLSCLTELTLEIWIVQNVSEISEMKVRINFQLVCVLVHVLCFVGRKPLKSKKKTISLNVAAANNCKTGTRIKWNLIVNLNYQIKIRLTLI